MTTRRPNHRFAKIHRNYTVEEIAKRFGVHRNTVREWVKRGLPTTDGKRPMLILGSDLRDFLQLQRLKNKRPCKPGELYCVRCRVPKNPAGDMADYQPLTDCLGSLVGICPTCEAMMYRRINVTKLKQVCGKLAVTMPKERLPLDESDELFVNSDLREAVADHDNAQPK